MSAKRICRLIAGILFAVFMLHATSGFAQLKDDHILGDMGLSVGTQAPPSVSVFVPVYGYNASRFVDSDGSNTSSPHVGTYLLGLGGSYVSSFKIFGAHYGATLLLALMSDQVEGTTVHSDNGMSFSDMYVQPLQLGWHFSRVDLTFGYALYIPTGKYEYEGDSNSGLGMWTNEFSLGTTWHIGKKRMFNLSTIAFYGIHSKKEGTELRAGNTLTLEGGFGTTFTIPTRHKSAWIIDFGPVYYAQFKVTEDAIPVDHQVFHGSKDHIYGLGLEAGVVFPKSFTSLSVRWLGEMGAKNRLQGNTFMITVAQPIRFFEGRKK